MVRGACLFGGDEAMLVVGDDGRGLRPGDRASARERRLVGAQPLEDREELLGK
jgi:hypothetical protein